MVETGSNPLAGGTALVHSAARVIESVPALVALGRAVIASVPSLVAVGSGPRWPGSAPWSRRVWTSIAEAAPWS
jgi:hypothetical protein